MLAGALVAEAAMELFHANSIAICPWALREGVILRSLDSMSSQGQVTSVGVVKGNVDWD